MKHFLNVLIVAFSSFCYASMYWLGQDNYRTTELLASTNMLRPWVYRQLVPFLVRMLGDTMPLDVATVLVVTLAGLGLYVSLVGLLRHFGVNQDLWVMLAVVAGLMLFGYERMPYDLMTAFLWTLSILFIVKQSFGFYILFPFVCLNRIDTALFLLLVWVLFNRQSWLGMLYLSTVFVLEFLTLRIIFLSNQGLDALITPVQNIQGILSHTTWFVLHVSLAMLILFFVLKNWHRKPYILKMMFLVLVPIFFGLYIVFGQPLETRVFWEIYPVTVALVLL